MTPLQTCRAILADQVGPDQVDAVLEHGQWLELQPGDRLHGDQERVSAMYLILEGQVALSVDVAGHTLQLGHLDARNWIGEVAYFSGSYTACSTVTARTPVWLFRMGFAEFSAFSRAAPEAACRLTHVLVTMLIHRLRVTAQNPVLDADGQLLLPVNQSLPEAGHAVPGQGILDFVRHLLGSK